MGYLTSKQGNSRRTGAYFNCKTCGREFYVYPSRLRRISKGGGNIQFCSMKCYDKTGKNNPMYGRKQKVESLKKTAEHPNRHVFTAENNPNFSRFGSASGFEGKSFQWWRDKLRNEITECERCGFLDKRAFTIHHKDRDRKNNNRDNLEVLCWNCHMIEHHKDKDGPWVFQQRKV